MKLFQTETPISKLKKRNFSPDVVSTVLICERTRGCKLEGTFANKEALIVSVSAHSHHIAW